MKLNIIIYIKQETDIILKGTLYIEAWKLN